MAIMRKLKSTFILLLLLLIKFGYSQSDSIQIKSFTVKELKEDFIFWRNLMEKKDPLIYLYTTKSQLDKAFDSIYSAINHPMSENEFFRLVIPISALTKDGHNAIYSSTFVTNQVLKSNYILPLELKFIKGKLYIYRNLCPIKEFEKGMEITSINSISVEEMSNKLISVLPRDGENIQKPISILTDNFRILYHLYFGLSPEYLITYIDKSGNAKDCIIKGNSLASLEEIKKNNGEKFNSKTKKILNLSKNDTLNTAIITIRSFDDKTIKKSGNKKFKKEIKNYFETILKSNTSNLIIDLRNNGGGNPNNVKCILQYLMNKSFEQSVECRIVKDGSKEKFLERTKRKWYPWCGIGTFHPKKNNFKGDLYVFIDEGTFSSGSDFASVLRKNSRAVFIGRETGGNPVIDGGYFIKNMWKLPNTKIRVTPGPLCSINTNLNLNTGRGLLPEYIIEFTYEDLFQSKDKFLNYAYDLIKNKTTNIQK